MSEPRKDNREECINSGRFKKGEYKGKYGEEHHRWVGDKINKKASLHNYIKRHKPKPQFCENCNIKPPFDLANISGEYFRDVNDFKWLCRSCHMKEDGRIEKLHSNYDDRLKEFCYRGHKLSGENLYHNPNGDRGCITCRRLNSKKSYERKRNAT